MPRNTLEQLNIIAEVEISCALNTMSISDGIRTYNRNGLENVSKGIEGYVKATKARLLNGKPGHMKAAGTNAKAMFKVLFKLGNEDYILNFISALEAEQELRENPNGEVSKAIESAKKTLAEIYQVRGEK